MRLVIEFLKQYGQRIVLSLLVLFGAGNYNVSTTTQDALREMRNELVEVKAVNMLMANCIKTAAERLAWSPGDCSYLSDYLPVLGEIQTSSKK